MAAEERRAAAAHASLPVLVRHLEPARGEGRRLRGLLRAHVHSGELGHDRAERAGHEPPAAELFEKFHRAESRPFLDARDHHRVRRDVQGERAAHGRRGQAHALTDIAPKEDRDAPGGLALLDERGDLRRIDSGRLELRAGHLLEVLGEFFRGEFLMRVWLRRQREHGGWLAVLHQRGGAAWACGQKCDEQRQRERG